MTPYARKMHEVPGFTRPPDSLPHSWDEMIGKIGGTPIAAVNVQRDNRSRHIYLKLEKHNPLGSIKDRTAYALIRAAEAERPEARSLRIVESTSGNLGAALAALCALRGHSFVAVVDPKVSPANLSLMRYFGARIETADRADEAGSYLKDRLYRVQEICDNEEGAHWTNQYKNPANPRIHFLRTGPEVLCQMSSRLDSVFVSASTGGTLAGIASYLRIAMPAEYPRIIGVDARGSVALGGLPSTRHLTGHGASNRSEFIRPSELDATVRVSDADAVALCWKLRDEAGLCLGGSSGAAVAACIRSIGRQPDLRRPVCVCPDDGGKYRQSVYDEAWLAERGIDLARALERYESTTLRFDGFIG